MLALTGCVLLIFLCSMSLTATRPFIGHIYVEITLEESEVTVEFTVPENSTETENKTVTFNGTVEVDETPWRTLEFDLYANTSNSTKDLHWPHSFNPSHMIFEGPGKQDFTLDIVVPSSSVDGFRVLVTAEAVNLTTSSSANSNTVINVEHGMAVIYVEKTVLSSDTNDTANNANALGGNPYYLVVPMVIIAVTVVIYYFKKQRI